MIITEPHHEVVITGFVLAPNGQGISGAEIIGRSFPEGCAGDLITLHRTYSGAGGNYLLPISFHPLMNVPLQCVIVRVTPATGSAAAQEFRRDGVVFRMLPPSQADTVRWDLQLR